MSTPMCTTVPAIVYLPPPHAAESYLTARRGAWAWLTTRDSKRIGVLYLGTLTLVFAIGGLIALALHTELVSPDLDIMSASTYNRALTLHGIVLWYLFIVPSVFASLGNFVLPLMLGADNVALPRLNLAGFYLYLVGAAMTVIGCVVGDLDLGLSIYRPTDLGRDKAAGLAVTGVLAATISYLIVAFEFVTTVHRCRAPTVTWRRMPHFAWALYGASLVLLVSAPVTLFYLLGILFELGRHVVFFDPALGGDPELFRQLFRALAKTMMSVVVLTTWGVLLEILSVHGKLDVLRTRVFAVGLLFASPPIASLARPVLAEVRSEFVEKVIDSLITVELFALPILALLWGARLHRVDIQSTTAGWYLTIISFTMVVGHLTYGRAKSRMGPWFSETTLSTGSFHNAIVGIHIVAALAGLHHWWPKITGTSFNEKAGKMGAIVILIGLNLTFLTQGLLGLQGMPSGYFAYLPEYQPLQQVSTVGAWILMLGLGFVAANLLHSLAHGAGAPMNPWNASSLEWQVPSPPAETNFSAPPTLDVSHHDAKPAQRYIHVTDSRRARRTPAT